MTHGHVIETPYINLSMVNLPYSSHPELLRYGLVFTVRKLNFGQAMQQWAALKSPQRLTFGSNSETTAKPTKNRLDSQTTTKPTKSLSTGTYH